MKKQGHFYIGKFMGNQMQQFQPYRHWELGFKIPKPRRGPPQKYEFIKFKMTAKKTRSEPKKLQPSKLLAGWEIYKKLSTSGGLFWLGD